MFGAGGMSAVVRMGEVVLSAREVLGVRGAGDEDGG